MNIDKVDAVCLALSGAKRGKPLDSGVRCWTVEGRIFATMAEGSDRISVRCADERVAQLLVDHGRAGMLPGLPHGAWVAIDLSADEFELECRIMESYEMVRGGLD